jgi:hypothetical protein
MGIMEKLDAEDLILEEVSDTIARRQRKKNASKL